MKPADKFSMLFLVAGHDASKTLPLASAARALVQTVSPLGQDKFPPLSKKVFAVYYDADPIVIDFQRDGKQLVVPEPQRNSVLDRINLKTVPLDLTKQTAPQARPARAVWEPTGRFGEFGSSVPHKEVSMCLGEPFSLSLQTIPRQAPTPTPVRCVSEQGFSLPTPMCAVLPNRGRETRAWPLIFAHRWENKRTNPSGSEKTEWGPKLSEDNEPSRVPSMSLPEGGAMRGMGEKFAVNPVTGTDSMLAHNRGASPNLSLE